MQELSLAIPMAAALLHTVAYILYNIETKFGSKYGPNAASWSIWAFLATLNAFTYNAITDFTAATLLFFISSVSCTITFFYLLCIKKFSRLKSWEWVTVALGIIAVLVWWEFRNASHANLITISALAISFGPTFMGVLRDPSKEPVLPWVFWTLAFGIATMILVVQGGKLILLIAPGADVLFHGSIAVILLWSGRRRLLEIV